MVSSLVTCPACGTEFPDHEDFCSKCGNPRTRSRTMVNRLVNFSGKTPLEIAHLARDGELDALLNEYYVHRINHAVRLLTPYGYQVQPLDDRSATLSKAKEFNGCLWAVVLVVTLGVAFIVLLFKYLTRADERVFLEIVNRGELKITGNVPSKVRNEIDRINHGER